MLGDVGEEVGVVEIGATWLHPGSWRTGANTELGTSIRTGVQLALDDVNAAGGVNGHAVNVVQRDEGDNPAATALAVQDLIQLGADAIIGPTSSVDVLGTLRTTVRAGILSCSPTATALALDAFPSDGLFFRTIPSDSLQAAAIARTVGRRMVSGTSA